MIFEIRKKTLKEVYSLLLEYIDVGAKMIVIETAKGEVAINASKVTYIDFYYPDEFPRLDVHLGDIIIHFKVTEREDNEERIEYDIELLPKIERNYYY